MSQFLHCIKYVINASRLSWLAVSLFVISAVTPRKVNLSASAFVNSWKEVNLIGDLEHLAWKTFSELVS